MSSLNILLLTYVGLDTNLDNFFWSVTSLTSTLLLMFSIVFSNIELFISLKKSVSKEFLAFICFCLLKWPRARRWCKKQKWPNFEAKFVLELLYFEKY